MDPSRIRVTCGFCSHDVSLRVGDVQIIAGIGYHFDCPGCRMHNDKAADWGVLSSLEQVGVKTIETEQDRQDQLVEAFRAQMDDEKQFARFVYG